MPRHALNIDDRNERIKTRAHTHKWLINVNIGFGCFNMFARNDIPNEKSRQAHGIREIPLKLSKQHFQTSDYLAISLLHSCILLFSFSMMLLSPLLLCFAPFICTARNIAVHVNCFLSFDCDVAEMKFVIVLKGNLLLRHFITQGELSELR